MEKKTIVFRCISLLFITLSLILACLFLVFSFTKAYEINLFLHRLSLIVLTSFCLIEIVLISIGFKKPLMLQDIVFEHNGDFNKVGLTVSISASVVGVALFIPSLIWMFIDVSAQMYFAAFLILPCSVLLLANCGLYFIYMSMFKTKELTIDYLSKIHK